MDTSISPSLNRRSTCPLTARSECQSSFLYPTGFRRERRVVDSLELGQLRRGEEHGSAYDPGTLRSPVV